MTAASGVAQWFGSAGVPISALWLALAIDHWLGEPPVRWHPVVWMGKYLGWIGQRIPSSPPQAFVAGALAWCVGASVVCGVAIALQRFLLVLPVWATIVAMALLLKPLLAWRMLRAEVLAVETALGISLDAGRVQLARLVSRDVAALSEDEVRESAIESLAENLNDSVVAPIFWFVLFGLAGAVVYRFANTADAMWGYRGERGGRDWTWAGKWAARSDDVLSWLPARITALLLLMTVRPSFKTMRALPYEAVRTPSPNSGWPMAAMGLALGVRLGKPGMYVLNATNPAPVATDTARAASLGNRVVLMLAAIASLLVHGYGDDATAARAWSRDVVRASTTFAEIDLAGSRDLVWQLAEPNKALGPISIRAGDAIGGALQPISGQAIIARRCQPESGWPTHSSRALYQFSPRLSSDSTARPT